MDKVFELVKKNSSGKNGKQTNFFLYYSGHGASLKGKLNLVVPNPNIE